MGWLVGAAGIENNDVRNFKGLRGMRRSAKPLKNSMWERKGILIAPSKLPRSSRILNSSRKVFDHCGKHGVGFGLKFRGADGSRLYRIQPLGDA
jgi:hypothetical protein